MHVKRPILNKLFYDWSIKLNTLVTIAIPYTSEIQIYIAHQGVCRII